MVDASGDTGTLDAGSSGSTGGGCGSSSVGRHLWLLLLLLFGDLCCHCCVHKGVDVHHV
jgi:hypothetical protein